MTPGHYRVYFFLISPVHTVSSCHNPASLNQGSSACVIVVAARSVLKRDLRREQLNHSCVTATIIVVLVITIAVLTRCVIVELLLPARAKSWEWPLHLRQPSQGCPRCTWAVVPGQPALVKKERKTKLYEFYVPASPVVLHSRVLQCCFLTQGCKACQH